MRVLTQCDSECGERGFEPPMVEPKNYNWAAPLWLDINIDIDMNIDIDIEKDTFIIAYTNLL